MDSVMYSGQTGESCRAFAHAPVYGIMWMKDKKHNRTLAPISGRDCHEICQDACNNCFYIHSPDDCRGVFGGQGLPSCRISGCIAEDNIRAVDASAVCRLTYYEYAAVNGDAPADQHTPAQPETGLHAQAQRSV